MSRPSLLKSISYSLQGLRSVWRQERSFKIEVFGFVLTIIAGLMLKLTPSEWTAVILASGFVLGAEVVNTIAEDILDHLHPERHPEVGRIKDVGAALVLVAVLTAATVAAVILWGRL